MIKGLMAGEDVPAKEEPEPPPPTREELAETASPMPFINAEGKLDAGPNVAFDRLTPSRDLPLLPDRLISVIDSILDALPDNAPRMLRSSFKRYREHLAEKRTAPDIPVLRIHADVIAADMAGKDTGGWRDPGHDQAIGSFFELHKHFIARAEKDVIREDRLERTDVNEAVLDNPKLQQAYREFVAEAERLYEEHRATEAFVATAKEQAETASDLRNSPAVELRVSADDRISPEPQPLTARKRFIVNGRGFATTVAVLGGSVTIIKDGAGAYAELARLADVVLKLLGG